MRIVSEKSFFCIISIIATCILTLLSTAESTRSCRPGFVQTGTQCYKFTGLPQANFSQAIATCRSLNSSLANAENEANLNDIIGLIRRHGYHRQSYWIGVNFSSSSVRTSGHYIVEARMCTVISASPSYSVRNVICTSNHLFVCQYPAIDRSPSIQRSLTANTSCTGYGYSAHPTDCTKYVLCFNGNRFVFNCYRGSTFVDQLKRCLEGASCSTDFQSRGNSEESNSTTNARPQSTGGDRETTEQYDNYDCQAGYKRHRNKCYKVYRNFVQWHIANNSCSEDGAVLASIRNGATMRFIKKLVRNSYQSYWIGLNDKKVPEQFAWTVGTVLSDGDYQNWWRRAKQRYPDHKECVVISSVYNFQWVDAVCYNENGFICEKNATRTLQQPNTRCGQFRVEGQPRVEAVVGGTHARGKTHPWQASLRFNGEHKCGGSLIDRCWILTAAHCVTIPNVLPAEEPTEVVLGDYNLKEDEDNEEVLQIDSIYHHPDWEPYPVPTNDIALVKLQKCSRKHNPICLPSFNQDNLPPGTECNIAGYGTIDPKRKVFPDHLMEATVPLINQQTCQSLYKISRKRPRSYIKSSMFCAGYLAGGIDSCQGDSGGPLTCRDGIREAETQWGIVSWGNGCAEANRPGVYTRITHFISWIKNVTLINF